MKFIIEKERITGDLPFGELHMSTDENVGYRPNELFVSSLVGCSGILLRNILLKKRHPFENIEIEVSSVRNPNRANRIEQISIIAYVQSAKSLTQQQSEKIAKLVVKNCGMIQSIIHSIEIKLLVKSLSLNGDNL